MSALWILVANSWMQYPVGCTFNLDTVREMTSFWDVLLSPVAVNKFTHTVTSSFMLAARCSSAPSAAWYLPPAAANEDGSQEHRRRFGFRSGIRSDCRVHGRPLGSDRGRVQPMKLAALEALYDGEEGAAPTAVEASAGARSQSSRTTRMPSISRSLFQNAVADEFPRRRRLRTAGINDLVNGNPQYGIMPTIEKIERGRVAIAELERFKQARETGDEATLDEIRAELDPDTQKTSS